MSARAAWRLETIGFKDVYRYQAGKDDWWGARLPTEGRLAGEASAADVARQDVPTLHLHDRVAVVARDMREGKWPLAVVIGEHGIVLGRLRPREVDANPDAHASDLIVEGPRTIRGSRAAAAMGEWLDERKARGVLITTADGELIGYVRRDDL